MKNVVKLISGFGIAAIVLMACEKEEIKSEKSEAQAETVRTPVEGPDPVPYGPNLVVTFVNSDMPFVNPSACGARAQQPTCGTQNTLEVHVTNIGNAPTTSTYDILMDKPTGMTTQVYRTSPSASLAPGATDVFFIGPAPFGGCTLPFSRQQLILTCDIWDDVAETDETDNTARPYTYCGD